MAQLNEPSEAPEAPPKWNSWEPFHKRDTKNAKPGTYYVSGESMEYPPEGAPDTTEHQPAVWFSTKKNAEINEQASDDEKKTRKLTEEDINRLTSLQLVTHSRNHRPENSNDAGSGTWFEIAICKDNGETVKKLANGQSLSWLSHSNWFNAGNSTSNAWCRGRMFTKDDEIFKHLKAGDVISVRISAAPKYRNYAGSGYLVFGFGDGPTMYQTPKVNGSGNNQLPLISVHAQKRRECLMIPANDFSTDMKANIVQGGVDLMGRLLEPHDNDWAVRCHALGPDNADVSVSPNFDSAIELAKNKKKDEKSPIPPLKVVKESAIKPGKQDNDGPATQPEGTPKIIVWDDSEVNKEVTVEEHNADILIYQMHAPLWTGNLWTEAINNAASQLAKTRRGEDLDHSTIIVIDADDLRADGIRISRGISWEKTMEDVQGNIAKIYDKLWTVSGKEMFGKLVCGVHWLVRFGYEGVLHLRPIQTGEMRPFIFHMVPNMAEGDLLRVYRGRMSGIHLAFVTGLAASLARQPRASNCRMGRTQIGLAIELAIVWSHRFANTGFCKDAKGGLNYPEAKDINNYRTSKTRVIYGDQNKIENRGRWSLFNILQQRQEPVAAEVVKLGTEHLESSIPTAKFGSVQTADRTEIEGYRSTAAVIQEYLNSKPNKPLSIAVFGQPGAGKSFGVKQVIRAVLERGKDWEPIEANISQFLNYSDLVVVFRKIRNTAMSGETPVVLFDEFDSDFDGKRLGWLKYFLAPMQDGQFMDSGFVRPLGHAIFIFIGGTSPTFREFKYNKDVVAAQDVAAQEKATAKEAIKKAANAKRFRDGEISYLSGADQEDAKTAAAKEEEEEKKAIEAATKKKDDAKKKVQELVALLQEDRDLKQTKKPDFVSRLSAHINVKGPSKSDEGDKMFIMRRAMLLQAQLKKHFGVDDVKDIQVDETVLNALLKAEEFSNGTRSIELILKTSRLSGRRRFESSDLASDEQLSMHVEDVPDFHDLIEEPITLAADRPVDVDLYNKIMWSGLSKDQD
ncbi:hypothetical protein CDV36_000318 [Fusarium kuroshium]|uniref:ATPase AAA-type core domain-containing protein n=1 Tax=Fusarium kuroshium TaxID=2010991 RepID=A0A3M2SQS8_9HYPO|nr:hypothetical protein CDV36_000318 [Fusarium kuroshium]